MNVVFLCIGAAKAGTDWLHQQLVAHPQCHLRAIKELHYFDALENNQLSRELKKHRDIQRTALDRLSLEKNGQPGPISRRVADRAAWMDVLELGGEDIPAYLDYLGEGAAAGQVVADMTPAYALLPEKRFAAMAGMAPDVRFLFLLRDPVERLWSHVRMIAVRRDPEGKIRRQRCARILTRVLSGEETQIVARSDYAATLERLAAAVPGPQVLVEAFENMIQGSGFRRLCDFLGIPVMPLDMTPVHQGQALEMTRDQRRAAYRWLAPQYDAAERALGGLPQGWAREG